MDTKVHMGHIWLDDNINSIVGAKVGYWSRTYQRAGVFVSKNKTDKIMLL